MSLGLYECSGYKNKTTINSLLNDNMEIRTVKNLRNMINNYG